MGRTILSATQTWIEEEKALRRFVRALRKGDQDLIHELLALSRRHIAESSYASNLYPMDIYLMSMLLETYRKVKRLEIQLEALGVDVGDRSTVGPEIPELPSLVNLVSPAEAHPHVPEKKPPEEGIEYVDLQDGA
ncbi:MAG: hypothetical protein LLG42_06375 [Chloroflexi bacterium]|nr:hypothetical protein [Chloroflexota bacterium]